MPFNSAKRAKSVTGIPTTPYMLFKPFACKASTKSAAPVSSVLLATKMPSFNNPKKCKQDMHFKLKKHHLKLRYKLKFIKKYIVIYKVKTKNTSLY